jgi:hypothetical protein
MVSRVARAATRLMMAGFLTGSLCSFVEGPVDLIKCRLQAQHPHHLATTPASDLPSRGGTSSLFFSALFFLSFSNAELAPLLM